MKLILINGPCGVGKTTAARALHARLPWSVLIEVDELRPMISGYGADRERGFQLLVSLACAMADAALARGHDVIIDKILYEHASVDAFIALGSQHRADVFEFILWGEKGGICRRAVGRTMSFVHTDWELTTDACEDFWCKIDQFKSGRPKAICVNADAGPDHVLETIETYISGSHL